MKTIFQTILQSDFSRGGSTTCVLIFFCAAIACSSGAAPQKENQTSNLANLQKAQTDDRQIDKLRSRIEQIAAIAKGRVGVAATVLETGESISLNANERFPMQSVYKLPIGMTVMRQIDVGKIKLEQKVRVEKEDFVRKGM
ncbi:MAG TPA: serine hydrolase, partial [Pyrinomonadaceae bacterium]|nr:serine hydrolase [Pyrinomonadaceae bacterium]